MYKTACRNTIYKTHNYDVLQINEISFINLPFSCNFVCFILFLFFSCASPHAQEVKNDSSNKSGSNLISRTDSGYVYFYFGTKIAKDLLLNCNSKDGYTLISLNPKNPKDSILCSDNVMVTINSMNKEFTYNISQEFRKGDMVEITLNKNDYPVFKLKNRSFNFNETNYFALLNQKSIGIDDFDQKILNKITLEPSTKAKVLSGDVLNPINSFHSSEGFLDSLFKSNLVSNSFYQETKQRQAYNFYSALLQSRNNKLVDKHINKRLINDSLVNKLYYIQFLYSWAKYQVEKDFTSSNHVKYFEKCEEIYEDKSKTAVLFYALGWVHTQNKNEAQKLARRLFNSTSDNSIRSFLSDTYFRTNTMVADAKIIDLQGRKFNTLSEVAKIDKQQFYYIDFWASWCMPCKIEMPGSIALSRSYEKKGIKVLYLSIDENQESWKKATKQWGLKDQRNLLLTNPEASEIIRTFEVSAIPRYMIMDKEGKIINNDAPRPSDPKIREVFDELLKK